MATKKHTSRTTLHHILDDFLEESCGLVVRKQGSRWAFTNSQKTYRTRTDAYAGALAQVLRVYRLYEQAYTDLLCQ